VNFANKTVKPANRMTNFANSLLKPANRSLILANRAKKLANKPAWIGYHLVLIRRKTESSSPSVFLQGFFLENRE
jgi:hypothetical protein